MSFVELASGFTRPVDIVHAGDARLFVAEKAGRIRILNPSTGAVLPTPFLDISQRVDDRFNEQGLLGLAFHPNYPDSGYFYVHYTRSGGGSRIARFSRVSGQPDIADPNSEFVLLDIAQPFSNHNGGCLRFGPDGYLYIAMGDGGSGGDPNNYAQNNLNLLGKMLRIDVNGGAAPYVVPAGNPFIGTAGYAPEIWATGLRNPWRFSFDRLNGDIWIGDVGQNNYEEISRQPGRSRGGENYGWRCFEGFQPYNTSLCSSSQPHAQPVYAYVNDASIGQSVTGGYVYRGSREPGLYGWYLCGDYQSGNVWAIQADSAAGFPVSVQPQSENRRFSTFGEDIDGELYAANYIRGIVYRIADLNTNLNLALPEGAVQVSPLPWRETLQIAFQGLAPQTAYIQLYDLQGRRLAQAEAVTSAPFFWEKSVAPGIYLLEVTLKAGVWRKKVVVE